MTWFVKENTLFKYSECLQIFFCLIGKKHLVRLKRGTISAWIRYICTGLS